jgi:ribulose-phosphate 3-epimerase
VCSAPTAAPRLLAAQPHQIVRVQEAREQAAISLPQLERVAQQPFDVGADPQRSQLVARRVDVHHHRQCLDQAAQRDALTACLDLAVWIDGRPPSRRRIVRTISIPFPVIARRRRWLTGDGDGVGRVPDVAQWPTIPEVAPSILSADFGRMREQVAEVLDAGARVIHIDVMDGHFVPVITFGPKMVADLAQLIHEYGALADVHLMIEQPERHISQFADAGADSITVHVEASPHLHHTLHAIKELGCRAGVTLNPGTPVAALAEAARYADVLLCMSVNPGWGGQAFIPATLERLPLMRELAGAGDNPVAVEVDGGVNTGTIVDVYRAGANILVAGSAIFGAPSPGESFRELRGLVTAAGEPAWA